jgi:hypothetical protein
LALRIWHLAFGIWHLAFGIWRKRQFSSEPSLKAISLALAYHIASNRTAFRQLKYPCSGKMSVRSHMSRITRDMLLGASAATAGLWMLTMTVALVRH